ncbi:hypothetical protein Syun_030103 [Stephania yunnanensis]|uniref:UTP23 sensor motif region domain-containing protein n=1 Tax=Stephania yunnanensis TaxID=152371 RepID=A0AAP0E6X2_9MAGN
MRVKKQRRHRKIVRFYTACFGFREPFKVLCDGTIIHHLISVKEPVGNEAFASTLGGPVKLFTTRCVIAELKRLGASCSQSFQAANNLAVARCDHEKRKSAVDCILDVLGDNNIEHFFVASQDVELRKSLREKPSVPVIYGLRKALLLEPPSDFQRQVVKSAEEKHLNMTDLEHKLLQKRTKIGMGNYTVNDDFDKLESLGDRHVESQTLTLSNTRQNGLGVKDRPQFKRKKAKGPNPLSCKKRKNHASQAHPVNQVSKDGDNGNTKKTRKRKRSKKGIKAGETVS